MNLAIDFETTKAPRHLPWVKDACACIVSIYSPEIGAKTFTLYHKTADVDQREVIAELQGYINKARRLIAHNMKFELHWLAHLGLDVEDVRLYCTQVAEYVLSGQTAVGDLSLNALADKYNLGTKIDKVKLLWDEGVDTDEIPLDLLSEYCEHDCYLAYNIYQQQVPQISALQMKALISAEMEAIRTLQEMEYNGIKLDTELCQKYSDEYQTLLEQMDTELHSLFGREVNLNSSDQLSCALFGGEYTVKGGGYETVRKPRKDGSVREYQRKCDLVVPVEGVGFIPPPKTELAKEGIYSTSVDTLKILQPKTKEQRRVITLLLERSRIQKLKSTYFDGMITKVQHDGRIHPRLNQTVTVTGRLSSSEPNGQNIPRGNTGPAKKPFVTGFNP